MNMVRKRERQLGMICGLSRFRFGMWYLSAGGQGIYSDNKRDEQQGQAFV